MQRKLLLAGLILGGLLMLGPAVGMLYTMLGMHRSFQVLGSSGIADPQALSDSIGATLLSTAAGLIAGALGLLLSTVCGLILLLTRKAPVPIPPHDS